MKIRPVLIVFLSLLVLVHGYVGLRLLPWLPLPLAVLGGVWLALSCLLLPMVPRFWRTHHPLLAWVSTLSMGLFSWFFVLTLLRDVGLGLWGMLGGEASDRITALTAQGVTGAALLATLLGLFLARRTAPVKDVDIPLPDLPPALDGFTIVQLSDIHVGPTIKGDYLEAIVSRVNGLNADAVAITGDLVDGSVHELAEHTEPLARLQARHGVFFVTGNHEYYSGVAEWVPFLSGLGMRVLRNERVALGDGGPGGATFDLAGVDDWSARMDLPAALAGRDPDRGLVLMAHQPREVDEAVRQGVELQLSGHTHGGQIFPFSLAVRAASPYVKGLYRGVGPAGAGQLYVSRGTGYWGPPMRLGAPPELTRLVLTT